MTVAKPFRRTLIGLATVFFFAAATLLAGWLYLHQAFDSANEADAAHIVLIAPGSSMWQIAEALYEVGVVDDPNIFAAGVWQNQRPRRRQIAPTLPNAFGEICPPTLRRVRATPVESFRSCSTTPRPRCTESTGERLTSPLRFRAEIAL